MDGFTALRRMRERGDKTPIMMLTARGETRDRIEGFDSDADDYLPKPFDPESFYHVCGRCSEEATHTVRAF